MAFLVSLDQTDWRVLRCLCDLRPPASHPTQAETKILSHFSLQVFHSYIFQPITPERIEHEGNTATQPKFFSGHREVLQIWTWVSFCWVFTETLKFQHVFTSPLLLSKVRWPCFHRRMRLSISILSCRIPPVFFPPSFSHNTSFLANSSWALRGNLIAVSWHSVGMVWTQIAKHDEAQSLVWYC